VVGIVRSLGAVSPQTVSGTTWGFSAWSDGGAALHNISTPQASATYTATYVTAPAPPTSLTATGGAGQINLAWTDTASTEAGFKIERSADGVTFTQIATVGTSVTSYANTGLAAATTYFYRVRAYNSAGDSDYSNVAQATTLMLAAYDSALKAPKCASVESSCDSGMLLNGRATLGPEVNRPNTINGSCTDGGTGTFHADESNDRIKVSTTDGSPLAAGKTVRVDATVWADTHGYFSSDRLDLYRTANANSPSWTLIATLAPSAGASQVLSGTYTLPSGALQAVRARFRYQGSASPCATGSYDDHDDLVFAVGAGASGFGISASPGP
jgi:leucyl aminopeptidase